MAEGIVLDLANRLLGHLITQVENEVILLLNVTDELRKLKNTQTRIQAVLRDAEKQQALTNQDRDWIDKLNKILFDTEDLLDDFATEVKKRDVMCGGKVTKEVCAFFSNSNQLVYGHNLGKKLESIRFELDEIIADQGSLTVTVDPRTKITNHSVSSVPEVVIGREDDKHEIIERLLRSNDEERAIPIVGLGGMGKTTLAELVFNDKEVSNNFNMKLWISVPHSFDLKLILQKILESITKSKSEDLDPNNLKDLIGEKLKDSRYLLVLDDVWNDDHDTWDNLEKSLRYGKAGSKIMLTTRLEGVAKLPRTKIHRLSGLSDIDSWDLLKQFAFPRSPVQENPRQVEIGKEIASKCFGVPLVIRTVGRHLSTKSSINDWLSFKDDELSKTGHHNDKVLATLKLSYDHLPWHLKNCFSYCSLLPKGYEINVETLVQFWIAQGFVSISKSQKEVEDVGFQYFKDLWWRSFFQEVKKDTLGNIMSCKMHDLMHDLAVFVAGGKVAILNSNNTNVDADTLHVSFGFAVGNSWHVSENLSGAKKLRTFLLSIQKPGDSGNVDRRMEASSCEAICSNFKRLRVMGLHDSGIDRVTSSIKKLKHLRYLDASNNSRIEILDVAITKLRNLNVLNLSGCTQLKELPKNVTKLLDLICLDCRGCWNLSHMPRGLGKLTCLKTLTWFVVAKDNLLSKDIGGLEELGKLKNLRGSIEIRNLSSVKDDKSESALAKLQDKQHLQSLTLSWNIEVIDVDIYSDYDQRASKCNGEEIMDTNSVVKVELDERILESLKPNKRLQGLRVYEYRGRNFPGWLSSLTNLVEIWIVNCKQCHHLPSLDHLPLLKDLWLSELTNLIYIDGREGFTNNVVEPTFFPSLKTLRIWSCPNLSGWWKKGKDENDTGNATTTTIVDLPEFRWLSRLEIRNCPKLTWLPKFLLSDGRLFFQDVNLARLQRVSRSGNIKFLNCFTSFSNVVEIRVQNCHGCHYFPPLDQIPSLQELCFESIYDLEYIGTEVINSTGGGRGGNFFASLKKLWLWNCPNFKGWWKKRNDGDDDNGTIITTIAELPQFPCLSLLDIRNCPELIQLPLFPTINDKLYLKQTRTEAFQQTLDLKVSSSQVGLTRFPSGLSTFTYLKELWLNGLADREYVGIEDFPFLKKVLIWSCPNLKSWWKNNNGDVTAMATTTKLEFPTLSLLNIRHCPKFASMPLFPTLDDTFYLINSPALSFQRTIRMTSAALANIKELWIEDSNDITYIGINAFPFLKKIRIRYCPNLTGWWETSDTDDVRAGTRTMEALQFPQFPTLSLLDIRYCPEFASMPLFPTLDDKCYIQDSSVLSFQRTIRMTSMALTNIKELWIQKSADIKYIGINAFPFLKRIWIKHCPNLKGWWEASDDDEVGAAINTTRMSQFPCLSFLDVHNCPNFTQMPLFPTLDDNLYLIETSAEPFVQTMKLNAMSLTNLRELWLENIQDLDFICIESSPFLKKVWILDCPNLKGWGKNEDDKDHDATEQLLHFPCLSVLYIRRCPMLSSMPLFPFLEDELRLEHTSIEPLKKTMEMASLSIARPLSKLRRLWIQGINNFESVPAEWLQNLASLQELYVNGKRIR